jgi:hypothetical protein
VDAAFLGVFQSTLFPNAAGASSGLSRFRFLTRGAQLIQLRPAFCVAPYGATSFPRPRRLDKTTSCGCITADVQENSRRGARLTALW